MTMSIRVIQLGAGRSLVLESAAGEAIRVVLRMMAIPYALNITEAQAMELLSALEAVLLERSKKVAA